MTDDVTNPHVYFRNLKTGEIHRDIYSGGARFTRKECNLAQADEVEIEEPEALAIITEQPERACSHCIPDVLKSDINAESEPEFVMRQPDGTIHTVQLPREIARKIAIYRRVRALGFNEDEARFLLTAESF